MKTVDKPVTRRTLAIDTAFRHAVRLKALADAAERARERKAQGLKLRRPRQK